MFYVLFVGLLFAIISIFVLKYKIYNIEEFSNDHETPIFFTIRSKERNIRDIKNLFRNAIIGYTTISGLNMFKKIIQSVKLDKNVVDSFKYIQVNEINYDEMDIFIEFSVVDKNIKDYVLYHYENNKVLDQTYELVFVNGNYTFFIRDTSSDKQQKYKYVYETEKQSIGTETTFIISGKFDGIYKQINETTDQIILRSKKINGILVEKGDTILITNQELDKVEGIYTVKSVGRNTIMHKNVEPKTSEFVCIDENLIEQTSYRTEYSCENELDSVGNKKDIKMHWDKRCVRDFECPWYQNDSNYGCSNGYCRMPNDVRQVSYRYYDGIQKPKPVLKTPEVSNQDVDFVETNITIPYNVPYFEYNLDEFRERIKDIIITKDMTNASIVIKINEFLKTDYRLIHIIKSDKIDSFVIHRRGKPYGFYIAKELSRLNVKGLVMDETIFELIDLNNI